MIRPIIFGFVYPVSILFPIFQPVITEIMNKIYHPYRWFILAFYFVLTISIEIQWLTFASITEITQEFYQTSQLSVDFLSIIYMLVFILLSLPASYYIDKYGLKKGLLMGAYLSGAFGLLKALGAHSFTLVIIGQTGLAIAQPFILNALTKLGAKWFPLNERATVAGIGTLAQYIGIIIALAVTPFIIKENAADFGIPMMLRIYGALSAISALLVIGFVKDPPIESGISENTNIRFSTEQSVIHIFRNKDMLYLMAMFFIGLGVFNAISTCIDQITNELSMDQTGLVGGIMLIGGIVGASVLPVLSDKFKKRKPFIVWSMFLMIPGIIGLTYFESFQMLMISAFIFGFFIMSAGPIGFQYGAEASYPATESTSQGILLLIGQISGIVFVLGLNTIGVNWAMYTFIGVSLVAVYFGLKLNESYKEA